ncbi:MAG: HAMP domain-containing protein [Bdellovibrio sp.]|nr:MAG: HAMP domain-containing protein [Bdellovibrio sp.]
MRKTPNKTPKDPETQSKILSVCPRLLPKMTLLFISNSDFSFFLFNFCKHFLYFSETLYMNAFLKRLSLKFKLMILLIFLTSLMLSVYGFLALHDFEKDKISYVTETNASQASSLALQIKTELKHLIERIQFLMRGYSIQKGKLHPYTRRIFPNETQFKALFVFHKDPQKNEYILKEKILKKNSQISSLKPLQKDLIREALESDLSIGLDPQNANLWFVGLKFKIKGLKNPLVVIAALKSPQFLSHIYHSKVQDSYLFHQSGRLIIAPLQPASFLSRKNLENISKKLQSSQTGPTWGREITISSGDTWLAAASQVGYGDLFVYSLIPKSKALQGVYILMIKSLLFIFMLICITIFISVLSSTQLTSSLKQLLQATQKISKGDFDIEVTPKGEDEVGKLAQGFKIMTNEIKRLLAETAEKARMESELKTAQLVQSNLFPQSPFRKNHIEIQGYYQPASECSGDWWYYSLAGSKLIFCIGDATGHGVPAALVTSAAHSAITLVESLPEMPLSQIMDLFNKAIRNTSKGQVMMTFFLGTYDFNTNILRYSNASHDPPFLLRRKKEQITKKDIHLLMDVNGPRLGEKEHVQYKEAQVTLMPGDRLVLYTDGLLEMHNKKGKMFGERKFLKSLLEGFNENLSVEETIQKINKDLSKFREGAELNDDITFFIVEKGLAA